MQTQQLQRGCRYRIDPTADQQRVLASWFGSFRYVWNQLLEDSASANGFSLKKRLPQMKREMPWLADAPSQAFQISRPN